MLVRSPKEITPRGTRADGASVRDHNMSLVLHLAWQAGEISRIDLARESGLAPSTVSKIVGNLLEMQLLRETDVTRTAGTRAAGGRPPIVLSIDERVYLLLGIDLGATHVSVVLTNLHQEFWFPHGSPVLVNVGALVPHKGQKFLVDAMAKQAVRGGGIGLADQVVAQMLKMQEQGQ